ncbi:type VI secretion system contractile sheath small subunit [Rhodospirillum sp. A1_3_36]|uniref:type VI secretion system contractile sheath small subunit n=1 Tax=Rhodospirillum sp. A1_3_36 TaxID=3391666 RepID=UPI0039A75323
MANSGQKFVARNRAPRVQIEYDVELYGAEKTVELPFVMGVLADLSGQSQAALPSVADRKFLEIDVDNFDDRMKSIGPRAAFTVANTLTGEGNLSVDLTFESLEDFSPAAIAKQVEPLRKLLEARTRLSHLATYMDGKTGAEDLIAKLIQDPASFAALTGIFSSQGPADGDHAQVLDSLRALRVEESRDEAEDVQGALDSLRNTPIPEATEESSDVDLHALLVNDRPSGTEHGETTVPDTQLAVDNEEDEESGDVDLDTLLNTDDEDEEESDDIDLDTLLNSEDEDEEESDDIDLDTLLNSDDEDEEESDDIDLDTLLNSDDEDDDEEESDDIDLDTLLNSDDEDDDEEESDDIDLDTLLNSDDEDSDPDENRQPPAQPFGVLTLDRPEDRDSPRQKFRIALLGDFTGRASRGDLEIGDALARRKAIKFDIDTLDDVIARFATTLVLPIGEDGEGIEVKLSSLDDLHPDELYENVALFEDLAALRQRVARGDKSAIAETRAWAGMHPHPGKTTRHRAKGGTVPANRKLSDFQTLIGDIKGQVARPGATDDLIARIVGPHIQAAADPDQGSLLAALDEALSSAMRAILHHPDFQAVESTWRSLEFLARRVETSGGMDIVLYDVSAEEWAADLAAQDDLVESGLFRMLAEEPRLDDSQGPLSAVFGLYTLEETPPHAELLARMAKISDWMNAPFVAAITPEFLKTPKHERHPLVAKAWDAMRRLPEAAYAGLVAPRFLLRQPYGAKGEPVDPFDFEEFTLREGLKGMLWANPVILSATLMAATVVRDGKNMRLGEIMGMGDIPIHTMVDQYGDQIALPCTERLLNTRTTADVVARGFMPVLSVKGRAEVRQGSFQALSGDMLAGPWALTSGTGKAAMGTQVGFGLADPENRDRLRAKPGEALKSLNVSDDEEEEDEDIDLDSGDDDEDINLDFDTDTDEDEDGDLDPDDTDSDDEDNALDRLLASLDEDEDENGSDDEMDPELAALLEGL